MVNQSIKQNPFQSAQLQDTQSVGDSKSFFIIPPTAEEPANEIILIINWNYQMTIDLLNLFESSGNNDKYFVFVV